MVVNQLRGGIYTSTEYIKLWLRLKKKKTVGGSSRSLPVIDELLLLFFVLFSAHTRRTLSVNSKEPKDNDTHIIIIIKTGEKKNCIT